MDEKRRPAPGDPDYKGGIFYTTVYVNGEAKEARIEKDPNGNIISTFITDKILGIF